MYLSKKNYGISNTKIQKEYAHFKVKVKKIKKKAKRLAKVKKRLNRK